MYSNVKLETISYACCKSKQIKQMESDLTERLSELERRLAEDPSEDTQEEYSSVTSEQNSLLSITTRGQCCILKGKRIHLIF